MPMSAKAGAAFGLAAFLSAGATGAAAPTPTESWPPPGVSFYGDPAVPDISGLWQGSMVGVPGREPAPNRGSADGSPLVFWTPWPIALTPAFQKIVDERAAAAKQGRQLGDISARCLPFGMPVAVAMKVFPDEIVQTPGQVTFWINSTFPIVVWTDGRGHPADLKPSFNGHSTGQWVGDTLFVDTVGINGQTATDLVTFTPHSDRLHMRWTVRRAADDIVHIAITMDDPLAFVEPVTMTNVWRRKTDPRWQVLDDGSCFENNKTNVDDQGNTDGFVKF